MILASAAAVKNTKIVAVNNQTTTYKIRNC